eukprot:3436734-Pleurochrysis_carterae.AAC.1
MKFPGGSRCARVVSSEAGCEILLPKSASNDVEAERIFILVHLFGFSLRTARNNCSIAVVYIAHSSPQASTERTTPYSYEYNGCSRRLQAALRAYRFRSRCGLRRGVRQEVVMCYHTCHDAE